MLGDVLGRYASGFALPGCGYRNSRAHRYAPHSARRVLHWRRRYLPQAAAGRNRYAHLSPTFFCRPARSLSQAAHSRIDRLPAGRSRHRRQAEQQPYRRPAHRDHSPESCAHAGEGNSGYSERLRGERHPGRSDCRTHGQNRQTPNHLGAYSGIPPSDGSRVYPACALRNASKLDAPELPQSSGGLPDFVIVLGPAKRYHASNSGSRVRPTGYLRRLLMDNSSTAMLVFYAIVGIFLLITIFSGFYQVRTAEAVVVQRLGKFLRVGNAGINFKLPWLDQIAGRIDLRVQQLTLDVETKTKDNVFVKIPVSVQYHVI